MEHAKQQFYDVEGIARSPHFGGYVLDPGSLEHLVDIGVAVQAESDRPWAKDDARRAELAGHLRPYRPALEPVHIVHVPHGHREGPARRARGLVVLRLSVAYESVAVADDDEHAVTVDLPLARLLRHFPPDERKAVEILELRATEGRNGRVLVLAVFPLRKLFFFFSFFPLPFLLQPLPRSHRVAAICICIVCRLCGEQRRIVADDYASRERGKFCWRELSLVCGVEERIGLGDVGEREIVDDFGGRPGSPFCCSSPWRQEGSTLVYWCRCWRTVTVGWGLSRRVPGGGLGRVGS